MTMPPFPTTATPSDLVGRVLGLNPGMMTGPGTNTYLVGIDEIAVIDPGPDDASHLDAVAACGGDRIRWILVTHTHWDHIQGFPFFVPAYHPKVNIRILGYEGAVHGLRGALFEQMQTAFFPVGLNQMATHLTFEELADMQFNLGVA